LSDVQVIELIRSLREQLQLEDILVVSTCNRTEVYYSAAVDLSQDITKLLCLHAGLKSSREVIAEYVITYQDTVATVEHLFRVSLGLESHVLGDLQIINQIKQAYQHSADEQAAGPFLHRLMHTVFYANKRVVQETEFRDGAASVSYAAYDTISRLTAALAEPRVLIIGLGEIGLEVVRHFIDDKRFRNITIANRTTSKAQELSNEIAADWISIREAIDSLSSYDVIVTSLRVDSPIILKERLQHSDILSHKFFVDLAVPRAIDPAIEELAGIILYNIDQIQDITSKAKSKRLESIPEVEKIISHAIAEFLNWRKEMEVSPTINKIKNALEQIRKDEIARQLRNVDPQDTEIIEKITKRIVQKIVKLPALHLKAACQRGEAESMVEVLNELFDLESSKTNYDQH